MLSLSFNSLCLDTACKYHQALTVTVNGKAVLNRNSALKGFSL